MSCVQRCWDRDHEMKMPTLRQILFGAAFGLFIFSISILIVMAIIGYDNSDVQTWQAVSNFFVYLNDVWISMFLSSLWLLVVGLILIAIYIIYSTKIRS